MAPTTLARPERPGPAGYRVVACADCAWTAGPYPTLEAAMVGCVDHNYRQHQRSPSRTRHAFRHMSEPPDVGR